MTTPGNFIFEDYSFAPSDGSLKLRYRFDGGPRFEETLIFPVPVRAMSDGEWQCVDRAVRLLFLLAGVSYYKAYATPILECEAFPLDQETGSFMERVYSAGLQEFAYRNQIDLTDRINFATTASPAPVATQATLADRALVPVGGGKDSIVTIEALRTAGTPFDLFVLATGAVPEPIRKTVEASGLNAFIVERYISRNLFELNEKGTLNGHIPITAIVSAAAILSALLYGADKVVFSNEYSASAPTLSVNGRDINHQFSKSREFERLISNYVHAHICSNLSYFSLLRPLTEVAIAKRFADTHRYDQAFCSCNRAFRVRSRAKATSWCCDCPKCRFVFLALAPFFEKERLVAIFGRNLLEDETQRPGYEELCGIRGHKPFECVGDTEECALLMIELSKMPEWREEPVVRALAGAISAAATAQSGNFSTLFEFKDDHQVPDRFLSVLHAGG